MKSKIILLIIHILLIFVLIPAIITHATNSNTFGLVMGIISEFCWISLTILDVLDIRALKRKDTGDKL